jgi:hypothetical protein
MASQAEVPTDGVPVTELYDGLAPATGSIFAEPHRDAGAPDASRG